MAKLKEYLDDFDKEVLSQISKKAAIEAMSGLYSQLPVALIEQAYDFCNDEKYKDYNEYIFLQSRYNELSASELKRYYKLHNKMIKLFQNLPHHHRFKNNEVIHDAIQVVENRPIKPPKVEFIPAPERLTELPDETPLPMPIISGTVY